MTQSPVQPEIVNIYGRKGGRGIRPWLLLPKVIAVAIYVGGLTGVLGLWLASDFTSLELNDPRRALVLDQVSRLMVFLVVPALLVAIIFGIALLLQHPKQLLRMRWLQVKLIGLAILIPSSHFYCRARFTLLRQATDHTQSDEWARQLTLGLLVALLGSICVVILGRLKPRLGQNPARAGSPLPPREG
ncbi:MAG TPA: hypothetical protein VH518_04995 [Tepidisphaeraceae bacterium]|jgi:uncharacterized membrane protein